MTQAAGAAPFERVAAAEQTDQEYLVASQWQLIRWRFLKHKLAVISLVLLGLFYFVAIFAEFVAPYDPYIFREELTLAPPHRIRFIDPDGGLSLASLCASFREDAGQSHLRRGLRRR